MMGGNQQQQQQPQTGGLGGLLGGLGGLGALLPIVVGMLGNDNKQGGLGGLLEKFNQAGMGDAPAVATYPPPIDGPAGAGLGLNSASWVARTLT